MNHLILLIWLLGLMGLTPVQPEVNGQPQSPEYRNRQATACESTAPFWAAYGGSTS